MISPRKILKCLDEHWQVIEALIGRSNLGSFSFQDVQALIKRFNPTYSSEQIFKEAQRLLQAEVFIPLAKSSQLELNRAVLEFAEYLLQEHNLGMAEDIQSRIHELNRLARKLELAAKGRDASELKRFIWQMDERIREVVKHFAKNETAILNLVDKAKADERNLSLARRYSAVMEAFDDYIEPMLQLIDINGPFQATIAGLEALLSEQISTLEISGGLSHEKELLLQLRTRLLDMNQIGRESLSRSADSLMPLREELRKNTLLARNTSAVLGLMRKKGIDLTLSQLPVVIASDSQRFSLGSANQLTSYMAELADYQQAEYQLPTQQDERVAPNLQLPDYDSVLSKARSSGSITNLARWLDDSYPNLALDELLYLYQALSREDGLALNHNDQAVELTLQQHKLTLYPFSQEAKADAS